MNKRQLQRSCLLLLGGALLCLLGYQLTGASIDSAGVLHEAFWLIPTGYLLLLLGLVAGILSLIAAWRERR